MAKYFDDYWEKNVVQWESTIYDKDKKDLSFTERVAGLFRKDIMVDRRDSAVRYVAEYVKGSTVVDLGCAGGYLCQELLKVGAKKVFGIDISSAAIESAKNRFRTLNIPTEKYEFLVRNINDPDFVIPKCDFIISLGVISYMHDCEIDNFFSKLKDSRIFFDYWERRQWWSIIALCHYIYRKLKGYPFFSSFKKRELEKILLRHGFSKIGFYNSGKNTFVLALPK